METWLKSPSGRLTRDSPIEGISKLNPIVEGNENIKVLDNTENENDKLKTNDNLIKIKVEMDINSGQNQSTTPPGNSDLEYKSGGSASVIKRRLINKYGKNKATTRKQSSSDSVTPRSENIKTLLMSGSGSNRKRKRDGADNIVKCSKSLRLDSTDTEKENTHQQQQNPLNDKNNNNDTITENLNVKELENTLSDKETEVRQQHNIKSILRGNELAKDLLDIASEG